MSAHSKTHQNDSAAERLLESIRKNMRACMQCGTCSASCPNSHAMDLTPRQMWRMVLCGMEDEVLASNTFFLCSSCYCCTLRCPRGLPLTESVAALKRLAVLKDAPGARRHATFYNYFVDNIRRHGRVREADLMARYLIAAKSPALAMRFAPVGLRMFLKGKVNPFGAEGSDQNIADDIAYMFTKKQDTEELP